MSTKLTPAQRRILTAATRHMFGRIVGGDTHTRELLIERGLIEPDGFRLFKITDAGRQAVAPPTNASPIASKKAP